MSVSGAGKGGANGNVYNSSAGAYAQAGNAMSNAQTALQGNTMQQGGAVGYDPALMQAATGQAQTAAGPASIQSGVAGYMNPYENSVIANTATDINTTLNQQLDNIGANAATSGAFGGSRHGLVEATAMSEAQKNIGDFSSKLRNQGYNTALQYSGQDIANQMGNNQFNAAAQNQFGMTNLGYQNQANAANQAATNAAGQFGAAANNSWNQNAYAQNTANSAALGNVGALGQSLGGNLFDIGQSISSTQASQGKQQQDLLQSLMDKASGQYSGYTDWGSNILNMSLSALGMNPMQQATTTTGKYTPGLFDYLSLGSQMLGYSKMGK
jgi:hypothetical protein